MPEDPEDSDHSEDFELPPPFFPYEEGSREDQTFFRMDVAGVFSAESPEHSRELLVLLTHDDFRLSIRIGPYEAQAISMSLENAQPDRPLTHDLIRTLIDRLGWELESIQIDDLFNGIYYAKLNLKKGSETIQVDSRPSDAIAIAVRFDAPILVAADLVEEVE